MNAVRDYVASVQRPFLEELKDKDILADDFFDSRLMSSSYITREVYKIRHAKQNIDYDYKLVSLNPLNPSHIGTEFENKILNDFKENKYNSYSSIIIDENHTPYYYVGLPIKHFQASCTDCHTPDSALTDMDFNKSKYLCSKTKAPIKELSSSSKKQWRYIFFTDTTNLFTWLIK
ncbi:Tll0287-like domain-containing protein [Campylobacter iguaniorum]|uniref:Tll0287-like domain-containing protein n=1 Tax=Campylobacter iguaniorum TaxID=1244531 RepID=UPI0007C96DB5|nr:DUF3365 domain-containing protein [Campylobacter iguaniorum]